MPPKKAAAGGGASKKTEAKKKEKVIEVIYTKQFLQNVKFSLYRGRKIFGFDFILG